jgi:hypothetical protein
VARSASAIRSLQQRGTQESHDRIVAGRRLVQPLEEWTLAIDALEPAFGHLEVGEWLRSGSPRPEQDEEEENQC